MWLFIKSFNAIRTIIARVTTVVRHETLLNCVEMSEMLSFSLFVVYLSSVFNISQVLQNLMWICKMFVDDGNIMQYNCVINWFEM